MPLPKLTRPIAIAVATTLTVATALTAVTLTTGFPTSAASANQRAVSQQAGSADDTLSAALDQILASPALAGSVTGMQVLDGATGAVVYSKDAAQRIIPASNEKLMTSSAALTYLGAAYRFHTSASYSGTKSGKTVTGNLYFKGFGDPTLTDARIDYIAAKVAAAGITKFTGNLVADDSAFDHTDLGSNWSWDDESYPYAAPISALTAAADSVYDTGSVAVATKPGAAKGKAGVLSLSPRNSYVKITNNTVTGAAGTANTVNAVRSYATNTIVVSGSIPLKGATSTSLASVQNPTLLAASAFRDALTRHKVTVTGATVVKATTGTVKTIYNLLAVPLSDLLVPFLKLSNNGHAELLTKAMGAKASGKTGTWSNGLAQVRTTLAGLGVSTSAVTMVDGSGLSRRDLLTTGQIASLLNSVQTQPWFTAWYNALPIGGATGDLVGGTLTSRFKGTAAANNVHAKTGTLTGVNAISGYVNDTTGRRLVFSAVSNNATSSVTAILDQAVVTLANAGTNAAGLRAAAQTVKPQSEHQAVTRQGDAVECSWVHTC
jgi:D-alanyl-D-alanine carboxypeptidase/D-alanyl-D-alanine-endopeptidase (penicillin-binding protein 4)